MSERRFFVTPNGDAIVRFMAKLGWSVEMLAQESSRNARTIESAIRGERKRYKVLESIANVLKVQTEEIAIGLPEDPKNTWGQSRIHVLSSWEPIWPAMELAERSILIIDSFFSEFGHLDTALAKNAKERMNALDVSVYMASPNKDFGAQREREMTLPADDKSELFCLLDRETTQKEFAFYEGTFHKYERGIVQSANHRNVSPLVYEYICMPSLRIVFIDETHLFFGWFPLSDQNFEYSCLYLKNEGLGGADAELYERLIAQIGRVKRLSIPAIPELKRPRRKVSVPSFPLA